MPTHTAFAGQAFIVEILAEILLDPLLYDDNLIIIVVFRN
jgi:hypothetical protein